MVCIDVIECFCVEVMCFCSLFILLVSVGWYFMVDGIWLRSVDIFDLVWVNWKMLLMNSNMF